MGNRRNKEERWQNTVPIKYWNRKCFKPVSQEDHNNANELNALHVKINRLEHENKSLAQEVDRLKQQIITMKSQGKNIDSQPENAKKVQSKKSKRKKQTPSTPHPQQQEPPSSKKQQRQQQKTPREEQQQQHSNEIQLDCQNRKESKTSSRTAPSSRTNQREAYKIQSKGYDCWGLYYKECKRMEMSRTKTVKTHSFSGANRK